MRWLLVVCGVLSGCDDATDTPGLTASCEDEPIDACPTDRWLDAPGGCIAERRAFCLAGTDVDELETVATDPGGSRWLFGGTTIPEGWTAVDADPAEASASAWGDCAS